jgi:hypothetical protein
LTVARAARCFRLAAGGGAVEPASHPKEKLIGLGLG